MNEEERIKFISECKLIKREKRPAIGFKEFHQESLDWACKKYLKDGKLLPYWFTQSVDMKYTVRTPWDGADEKDIAARLMKSWMNVTDAVCYSMVSEAWTAAFKPGHPLPTTLVNHPDKKEILLLVSESTTERILTSFDIVREGWKIQLKNEETTLTVADTGRFVGLLRTQK